MVAGLLAGKSDAAAVRDAGFSEETARAHAHEIIRRPSIQSELTQALRANGLTPQRMADIIKDAADAKMVVYNPDTGGGIMVDIPAHAIRLKAYDRWERAHGFGGPLSHLPPVSQNGNGTRYSWDQIPLVQRIELRDKIAALIESYLPKGAL